MRAIHAMNDSGYWKGRPRLPAFIWASWASHWSTKSSEREFAALDQELIIYTPVTLIGARAPPTFVSLHEGAEGTSGIFCVGVGGSDLCNTAVGLNSYEPSTFAHSKLLPCAP